MEEDIPTIESIVVVAPPTAIASSAEPDSGIGMTASCVAPAAKPWGPLSSEMPWALDPWGEGVTFGFDALESRSRVQ
jgi:hypothetical protein